MHKLITKKDLEQYKDNLLEYSHYCRQRKLFKAKLNSATGEELAKYKIALSRTNLAYEQLKKSTITNQKIIKNQISKLKKSHHKNILTMRYLYLYKWSKIIEILFGDNDDFEEEKEYKYKDKALLWHRKALYYLEQTNEEEKTATKKLKIIKKMCEEKECSYQEFFNKVKSLVI